MLPASIGPPSSPMSKPSTMRSDSWSKHQATFATANGCPCAGGTWVNSMAHGPTRTKARSATRGARLQNALQIALELNREKGTATVVQNCLATAYLNHADYLTDSELRPAEAVAELDQARILYDRLADRHPDEVDYRWGQALARGSLGTAYRKMKSTGPARIALGQAAGHYNLLVADHPQVLQFATERRAVYDELAHLELDSGTAGAAAWQIVRAIRVRIDVIAAIARSELGRQEKVPALKQRIRELARDSTLSGQAARLACCDEQVARDKPANHAVNEYPRAAVWAWRRAATCCWRCAAALITYGADERSMHVPTRRRLFDER